MNVPAPVLGLIAFVSCIALAGVYAATGANAPEWLPTLAGTALGVIGGASLPGPRPPAP